MRDALARVHQTPARERLTTFLDAKRDDLSKRFDTLGAFVKATYADDSPENALVRNRARSAALLALTYVATCEPERLAAARDDLRTHLAQSLTITPTEVDRACTPFWCEQFSYSFEIRRKEAIAGLKENETKPARRYLADVARLPAEYRADLPDTSGVVEALLSHALATAKTSAELARMLPPVQTCAQAPKLCDTIRETLSRMAAAEVPRCVPINAGALADWGVTVTSSSELPPVANESMANIIADFAGKPHLQRLLTWLAHDDPEMRSWKLGPAVNAIADAPDVQQSWVINRLRSKTSPYYPREACPVAETSMTVVRRLLDLAQNAPVLGEAATAALIHPSLTPTFTAHVGTINSLRLVDLRETVRGRAPMAQKIVENELAKRREQTAQELDEGGKPGLAALFRQTAVADAAHATDTPLDRARGYIKAGRAFLGPKLLADLAAFRRGGREPQKIMAIRKALTVKLELLSASRSLTFGQASLLASTIDISGRGAHSRIDAVDGLAEALHYSNGEAALSLSALRVAEAGVRARISAREILSSGDRRPVLHEAGHAWERARADVAMAAKALVMSLALSSQTYPLSDLSYIFELAKAVGKNGLHEKLLRHYIAQPPTRLQTRDDLVRMFGHMVDVPSNVARVAYSDDERAFPVVGTPYIGKSYPEDTEITSMGFEGLASGHAAFDAWMEHPEAFLFVLGALQAPADAHSTPIRSALASLASALGWR